MDAYAAVQGTTTQRANAGIFPHKMLAQVAILAAYATFNGVPADWGAVDWNSVDWNAWTGTGRLEQC